MPEIKHKKTERKGRLSVYVYVCTECGQEFAFVAVDQPDPDDFEFCENCGLPVSEIITKGGRKNGNS